MKVFLSAFAIAALASASAQAYVVKGVIFAGQSNSTGPENPAYVPHFQDALIRLYPEFGARNDEAPDMSIGEAPPAIGDPAVARWLQPVDMTPFSLEPIIQGHDAIGSSAGEITMGRSLYNNFPTVHWAVIKFGYGSSSLNRNWLHSPSIDFADRMILHVSRVRQQIESEGNSLRIVGFVWTQGGGDTLTSQPQDANLYLANLRKLVAKVRGFERDDRIPVVVSRVHFDFSKLTPEQIAARSGYAAVRSAQENFVATDDCAALVNEDTIPKNEGGYHFTQPDGYDLHGVRVSLALQSLWGAPGCQAIPGERHRRRHRR